MCILTNLILGCFTIQLWSYCIVCVFNAVIFILVNILCYEDHFRNACLSNNIYKNNVYLLRACIHFLYL